jgi:hypothetical protein
VNGRGKWGVKNKEYIGWRVNKNVFLQYYNGEEKEK